MGTGDDKEPLDVETAVKRLNKALRMQYRSALAYTVAAGAITGFQYQPLAPMLWSFAAAELEDARHLIEKIVTLGGVPATDPEPFSFERTPEAAVNALIETETETVEALQDVIPATGQAGDSEALEHRLEHIIMRKQEQVDTLRRARRSA